MFKLSFSSLIAAALLATALLTACGSESEPAEAEVVSAYDLFMDNLRAECGNAYAGSLTLEPEGDTMLDGRERLLVHFRECEEDVIRVPFHIEKLDGEWDRSRTWIFTRTEEGIDLRHDHRKPDGSDDSFTMYGGPTHGAADPNQMEFISHERTEETGIYRGWRIIIEPGVRYVYGTHRGGEWSWRVDFDLTQAVDAPPAPWGHE
ncbi:MAG: hypothetical protein JJU35_03095 [Balneolales bacterium]|nr:hypothetical protein [Balneolales bacterium]